MRQKQGTGEQGQWNGRADEYWRAVCAAWVFWQLIQNQNDSAMEVDESAFRVPSASPVPPALSAARLPRLQIAHSTPLVSSRKPQFGSIPIVTILM